MSFEHAPITQSLMIGLSISSLVVGLFDVKHYFHVQVGTLRNSPLHCSTRTDIKSFVWLVGPSYLNTSSSQSRPRPFVLSETETEGMMLFAVLEIDNPKPSIRKFHGRVPFNTAILSYLYSGRETVWVS